MPPAGTPDASWKCRHCRAPILANNTNLHFFQHTAVCIGIVPLLQTLAEALGEIVTSSSSPSLGDTIAGSPNIGAPLLAPIEPPPLPQAGGRAREEVDEENRSFVASTFGPADSSGATVCRICDRRFGRQDRYHLLVHAISKSCLAQRVERDCRALQSEEDGDPISCEVGNDGTSNRVLSVNLHSSAVKGALRAYRDGHFDTVAGTQASHLGACRHCGAHVDGVGGNHAFFYHLVVCVGSGPVIRALEDILRRFGTAEPNLPVPETEEGREGEAGHVDAPLEPGLEPPSHVGCTQADVRVESGAPRESDPFFPFIEPASRTRDIVDEEVEAPHESDLGSAWVEPPPPPPRPAGRHRKETSGSVESPHEPDTCLPPTAPPPPAGRTREEIDEENRLFLASTYRPAESSAQVVCGICGQHIRKGQINKMFKHTVSRACLLRRADGVLPCEKVSCTAGAAAGASDGLPRVSPSELHVVLVTEALQGYRERHFAPMGAAWIHSWECRRCGAQIHGIENQMYFVHLILCVGSTPVIRDLQGILLSLCAKAEPRKPLPFRVNGKKVMCASSPGSGSA